MAADGNDLMMDLIERTGEPLMPWLSTRFKRATPKTLAQLYELQERRSRIEKALMKLWTLPGSDKTRRIDAIIHPVAPHPVPEIDRWNAVGYTSSFVLLDWPAGTIPVRNFTEADLELGKEMDSKILTSWDERNRELCKSCVRCRPASANHIRELENCRSPGISRLSAANTGPYSEAA
jgi:hypothetical protein